MSVNLMLLPLADREALNRREIFCGTQLRLDADNELIEMISGLGRCDGVDAYPIPDGAAVQYCGEEGLVVTCKTEMGGPLYFTYAGELRKIERRWRGMKKRHISPANAAAMAYVSALPKDAPVFLNWC